MKIAHVALSCFYIDGMGYQENLLVRQHVADGHDVLVVASTENMDAARAITYCAPGDYLGRDDARVVRLPYRAIGPHALRRKLRAYKGAWDVLVSFAPDAILFHGTCAWELRTVARYARAHPDVLFYIDSHEDAYNSARSFVSREVLHKRFYGPILRSAEAAARKILCVSIETMDFVAQTYGIARDRLEFYPLGGSIPDDAEYARLRAAGRAAADIGENDILLVQSGKQTARKKLLDTLDALAATPDPRLKLFVAGSLHDDIAEAAMSKMAADPRVSFKSWLTPDQLTQLLCAADVYVQPGTQSATMQHALCCRCALILDDVPSHVPYQRDNGWFLSTTGQLAAAFAELPHTRLDQMQNRSLEVARELLDYEVLAQRILR